MSSLPKKKRLSDATRKHRAKASKKAEYQLGDVLGPKVKPFRRGSYLNGEVNFGDASSAAATQGYVDANNQFFPGPIPESEEAVFDDSVVGEGEFDDSVTASDHARGRRCVPAEYHGPIKARAKVYAKHLFDQGYVVIPSAYQGDLRADLEDEFMHMPEFKHHLRFDEIGEHNGYICGASAFASNPSVFHNETSRTFRQQTTAALFPFFQELTQLLTSQFNEDLQANPVDGVRKCPDLMLRSNSDRIQVRGRGRSPAPEMWHQDLNPTAVQFDVSFGGWENCDPGPQHLSAIKGTHTLNEAEIVRTRGFTAFGPAEKAQYDRDLRAQIGQHDTNADGKIIIPPKHFILFFGNLVHSVNPTSYPYTSVKQFNGYTLTPVYTSGMSCIRKVGDSSRCVGAPPTVSTQSMWSFKELEKRMKANAVMTLMSGQTPPMYPANYLVCWNTQADIFKRFQAEMLVPDAMKYPFCDEHGVEITCPETEEERMGRVRKRNAEWAKKDAKSGPRKDPRDLDAPVIPLYKYHTAWDDETRSMKSLKELGMLGAHPRYTQEELDMARPRKVMCIYSARLNVLEEHKLYKRR